MDSPENNFSLGQSFNRVPGNVSPEDVEIIGDSEAKLVPEAPYTINPDDLLRLRVEVSVKPDGTFIIPTPLDPDNINLARLTAYTYMSAELRGIDVNKFEIYPPLTERYMLQLSRDEVNFWEWELRPKPEAVGKTNYLSVKFLLPERSEDGTIIHQEGDGTLRFEVNVLRDTPNVTATARPDQGMRLIINSGDQLILQLKSDTTVDRVWVSTSRSEAWFDTEFGVRGIQLAANTCLVYQQDSVNLSLPTECRPTSSKVLRIPYGDVFWYDFAQNMVLIPVIKVGGGTQYPCDLSSGECDF